MLRYGQFCWLLLERVLVSVIIPVMSSHKARELSTNKKNKKNYVAGRLHMDRTNLRKRI